jgi:hypothetical protein
VWVNHVTTPHFKQTYPGEAIPLNLIIAIINPYLLTKNNEVNGKAVDVIDNGFITFL